MFYNSRFDLVYLGDHLVSQRNLKCCVPYQYILTTIPEKEKEKKEQQSKKIGRLRMSPELAYSRFSLP